MSYYVFFSYTHHDDNAYLQRFLTNLTDQIGKYVTLKEGEQIVFFDKKNMSRGDKWDDVVVDALQTSKVMVCVYSPNYFAREYCGREWQIFQQRRELYRQTRLASGERGVPVPPLIKPVVWIPFVTPPSVIPQGINEAVAKTQYLRGDSEEEFNKAGLDQVLRSHGKSYKPYVDYVDGLAREILAHAAQYDMPALREVEPLDKVPSAFFIESGAGDSALPRQFTLSNRNHVRFVFVAADPANFGSSRSPEAYKDRGRGDWRPFFPDETIRIFPFVQLAVSQSLEFSSDEIPFDNRLNLRAEVGKAWSEGKLVILLVDGWTLDWDGVSRRRLEEFDHDDQGEGHFYYNCAVLVPWNDKDQDIESRRAQIEQTIATTFHFRTSILKNPIYYRDSIRTKAELSDALSDILINIKAEIRKKEKVSRPLPTGSDNPGVSGPGAPVPSESCP